MGQTGVKKFDRGQKRSDKGQGLKVNGSDGDQKGLDRVKLGQGSGRGKAK